MYGTCTQGGSYNSGTLYRLNPQTGEVDIMYNFQSGVAGSLTQGPGTVLYSIGGGGTHGYGFLYSYDVATQTFTDIYNFDNSVTGGAYPQAGLVYSAGVIYGTTYEGGANHYGTAYAFNVATGSLTLLYSLTQFLTDGPSHSQALLDRPCRLCVDAWLLLVPCLSSCACLSSLIYVCCVCLSVAACAGGIGSYPTWGPALTPDGYLLYSTIQGSLYNVGALVYTSVSTGQTQTIYPFPQFPRAVTPLGLTMGKDGYTYGLAYSGGSNGYGVIFRIVTPTLSTISHNAFGYEVLYSFTIGGAAP